MKILHYNNYNRDKTNYNFGLVDKNIPLPWNTHFYFTIEDSSLGTLLKYKFYIIADDWEKQIKYQCKNKSRYLNDEAIFKFKKVEKSPNLYNPPLQTNSFWVGVYNVYEGKFYVSSSYTGTQSIIDWILERLKGI